MNLKRNDYNFLLHIFYRTLNNNNLTTLPHNLFVGMNRVRTLQLADNPLSCDCTTGWLSRWLRVVPRLIAHARCFSPQHLRGQNLLDLHDIDFKCSGIYIITILIYYFTAVTHLGTYHFIGYSN